MKHEFDFRASAAARAPARVSTTKAFAAALAVMLVAFGHSAASAVAAGLSCTAPSGRFKALEGEVTDSRTGLVWKQCAAGQTAGASMSGDICTGTPMLYTHEQALEYAREGRDPSLSGWRLPDAKELFSLTEMSCSQIRIDTTAFPSTGSLSGPHLQVWASTAVAFVKGTYAYQARFDDGTMYLGARSNTSAVRLVRVSTKTAVPVN